MNQWLLRPLLASDLGHVKQIDRASFSPQEQYDDAVYALMPQSGRGLVAQNTSGLIVGYVFIHPSESPHPNGDAFGNVRSIAVHPDHRHRGYGKALLEAAIAQSDGDIDLFVDEDNESAIKLYESLGFRPAEMRPAEPSGRRMVRSRYHPEQ